MKSILPLLFFESAGSTDTVSNIGFRLRGNTSRAADKKSFKISFNTFNPGGSWEGIEKMNLNGEHNDPSVIRARLIWEGMRDAGLPVSRSNHVNLFVNGVYHGLYYNLEHIDEEWLEKRFVQDHGNLWKCTCGGIGLQILVALTYVVCPSEGGHCALGK